MDSYLIVILCVSAFLVIAGLVLYIVSSRSTAVFDFDVMAKSSEATDAYIEELAEILRRGVVKKNGHRYNNKKDP